MSLTAKEIRLCIPEDFAMWYSVYGFSHTEPEDGYFEYVYANDNDGYDIPA